MLCLLVMDEEVDVEMVETASGVKEGVVGGVEDAGVDGEVVGIGPAEEPPKVETVSPLGMGVEDAPATNAALELTMRWLEESV